MKINLMFALSFCQIVNICVRRLLVLQSFHRVLFFLPVEVTKLDQLINRFFADITDGRQAIRFPQCPQCSSAIRHCQRYIPIINQIEMWIKQIKTKQQNGVSNAEMVQQRTELVNNIRSTFEQLKVPVEHFSKTFDRLSKTRAPMNIDQLNYLKNTAAFLAEIKWVFWPSVDTWTCVL